MEAAEQLPDERAALLEQEIFDEVEELLSCLKESDRQLFRQLFVEDMTVEQVAQNMNISRDVLYNRVSRGRKQLRQKYCVSGKE